VKIVYYFFSTGKAIMKKLFFTSIIIFYSLQLSTIDSSESSLSSNKFTPQSHQNSLSFDKESPTIALLAQQLKKIN